MLRITINPRTLTRVATWHGNLGKSITSWSNLPEISRDWYLYYPRNADPKNHILIPIEWGDNNSPDAYFVVTHENKNNKIFKEVFYVDTKLISQVEITGCPADTLKGLNKYV